MLGKIYSVTYAAGTRSRARHACWVRVPERYLDYVGILTAMTKMLERAVAQLRELSEETQDLAAEALLMVIEHVNDEERYRMTEEQIEGVRDAMAEADRGGFASDREVAKVFGKPL